MTLVTAAQRQKLLENGRAQRNAIDCQDQVLDFGPAKLFTADGDAIWLLREITPDSDLGLCDLGLGEPELGCVSLRKLADWLTPKPPAYELAD